MIVTQQEGFSPVTIVLETLEELRSVNEALFSGAAIGTFSSELQEKLEALDE